MLFQHQRLINISYNNIRGLCYNIKGFIITYQSVYKLAQEKLMLVAQSSTFLQQSLHGITLAGSPQGENRYLIYPKDNFLNIDILQSSAT